MQQNKLAEPEITVMGCECTARVYRSSTGSTVCAGYAVRVYDMDGVAATLPDPGMLPAEVYEQFQLDPNGAYVALCSDHDWYAPRFARIHPHHGAPKLMLEGRQWNTGAAGTVVIASVFPGVDWAAYIGGSLWTDHVTRFEQVQNDMLRHGRKLSFDDAAHFFPDLAGRWPEGYRS